MDTVKEEIIRISIIRGQRFRNHDNVTVQQILEDAEAKENKTIRSSSELSENQTRPKNRVAQMLKLI